MFKRFFNKKKSNKKEKNKEPTYWERVFLGKGTVAEPWPTAEELWNDPEVRKIFEEHNESVRRKMNSK